MDDTLFNKDGAPSSKTARVATKLLSASDPKLGKLIEKVGPYTLELQVLHNPYRALARAIVGQQITNKAALAIWNRTCAHFGGKGFPATKHLRGATDEELRSCGLSRSKAMAIRDLAEKTESGVVPSLSALKRMTDEAIVERLTAVRGVGVWTVQMLLMFRLGRSDVIPSTDYGVRKGFGLTFLRGALPKPKQIEARAEKWRPFRSVAAWYLWRALELP